MWKPRRERQSPPKSCLLEPIVRRPADEFIDRPTDTWVKDCLPENLRQTAYRLPSDCADLAVILRHVWLSAHHRTETYSGWTIGDRAGGPRTGHVGRVIQQVYSGNVAGMVNPYQHPTGAPCGRSPSSRTCFTPATSWCGNTPVADPVRPARVDILKLSVRFSETTAAG